ncbi:hypothetical protein EG329_012907 [Mollisiaceae sp. DMI_Dod_QoI]|nr:hypothetical protein EG329_012907 [Helotiales sp. DMI_Dod_QoI]
MGDSSATLSGFTCFPRLPTELRLKIWRHALPGGRIVHLIHPLLWVHHAPPIVPPTILAVNLESRSVALKNYTIIRQSRLKSNESRRLAYNTKKDIVYFFPITHSWPPLFRFQWAASQDARLAAEFLEIESKKIIRRLAIDDFALHFKWFPDSSEYCNLEELIIVVGNEAKYHALGGEFEERVLRFGEEVMQVAGWGDAMAQNAAMKILMLHGLDKTGLVVKLVRGFQTVVKDDGFCVPITKWSLHKR